MTKKRNAGGYRKHRGYCEFDLDHPGPCGRVKRKPRKPLAQFQAWTAEQYPHLLFSNKFAVPRSCKPIRVRVEVYRA